MGRPLDDLLRQALQVSPQTVGAALAPLTEYDRQHGGDLLHTLAVYLRNGGNASRTADDLFLHRSGLLYRLRRIEELLKIRLDSFDDRVALEIAVLYVLNSQTDTSRGPSPYQGPDRRAEC